MYEKRKRRKNVIPYIILAVLLYLLFLLASVVFNKAAGAKFEKMSQPDKQMFTEIMKIYEVFEKSSKEIWTENYRIDKVPTVLLRHGGNTYVFNVDLSKKLYAKKVHLPTEICGGHVYRIAIQLPSMAKLWNPVFDYGFIEINGVNAAAVAYNAKKITDGTVAGRLTGLTYSEYVKGNNKIAIPKEMEQYPKNRVNYGLKGIEFTIIDNMMACKSENELRPMILDFVAVREHRYSNNKQLEKYEILREMADGSAVYAAHNVRRLMGYGYNYFDESKQPVSGFKQAFDSFSSGELPADYITKGCFGDTGAALGQVLDVLPMGGGWRSAIENSTDDSIAAQYSLLREYCKQYCGDYTSVDIEDIKDKYDFEDLAVKGDSVLNAEMKK